MRTRQWPAALVAAGLACVWPGVPAGAEQGQDAAGPSAWVGDLSPIEPGDWNYDRAAHLLERAGFGGTPEEIEGLAAMTPEAAVDSLVSYESLDNGHLPVFLHSRDAQGRKLFHEILKPPFHIDMHFTIQHAQDHGESLGVTVDYSDPANRNQEVATTGIFMVVASRLEMDRAVMWWADRMLNTRRPLEEKMALFWHGHFATQHQKLHDYEKMLNQQAMFREHATGNFRDLLLGIAKDPAMIRFLDNVDNVVGHPNENFAREIRNRSTRRASPAGPADGPGSTPRRCSSGPTLPGVSCSRTRSRTGTARPTTFSTDVTGRGVSTRLASVRRLRTW